MIEFRQKAFSEYDAMRYLYTELLKKGDKNKWKVIDSSSLLPILKGNNVVIERFVITTTPLHRDRYRMYLKIGARAKMPDEVRLPERVYDRRLGDASLDLNFGHFSNDRQLEQRNNSAIFRQKDFSDKKKTPPTIKGSFSPRINISYEVRELLGEAVKYDKASRSLVLEFSNIDDAIRALNILPFGIDYKIYLLA